MLLPFKKFFCLTGRLPHSSSCTCLFFISLFFFCLLGHNGPLKHTHSNTHSTIHSYLSVSYDFETNLKSFYFDIRLFIPFICTLTHDRKKSLLMLSVQNILARNKKYKHRHLTFYRHALPHTIMFIEHMIYSSAFHPKQIFFLLFRICCINTHF